MEQIKKGKNLNVDVLFILALFVLARICCPALSNIPFFNMAFTFMYGASFVFLFLISVNKFKRQDFGLLTAAVCYTAYVFFKGLAAGRGLFARDSFNAYIIVFLTVIYIWVKEKPIESKVLLFKFISVALIFDYLYSILVLFKDPDASRISAALSVLEKSPYDILNAVGGFDAVYGGLSVVVILLCMRQIFKKNHTKDKLTLLVLVLALAFIIMAAYATAIVLLVVSMSLFLMQKNKVISTLIFCSIILLLIFHEPIGAWIMDISPQIKYSEIVSKKINDFGYMLKHFEAAGTYAGEEGRTTKLLYSWETFKKYPLFGGMGRFKAQIGGHSELLDFPGNFGLVGFTLLTAYFVCLYKNIRTGLALKEMTTCWKIIMLVFVLSAALNPSLYSLQMMPLILMIYLAPSYMEMCENQKR